MGTAAKEVSRWGAPDRLRTVTASTSTLSRWGQNERASVSSASARERRVSFCHMKPAVRTLSSWSGVKRAASCPADAPPAEKAAPSSRSSQKLRVERLSCRSSALTGLSRKCSWSVLASPPMVGVTALFIPVSDASGKYR